MVTLLKIIFYSLKLSILEYALKQRLLSVTEFIRWLPFYNFSLFLDPNHKFDDKSIMVFVTQWKCFKLLALVSLFAQKQLKKMNWIDNWR